MAIPLYKKIYDEILFKIRSGVLKEGDRLPSEKELASDFNVSRITSKKALDLLARDQAIERIQGKGSFVAQIVPEGKLTVEFASNATSELSRNHYFIGLVIEDFEDSYGADLLKSLEAYCTQNHSHLIFKMTKGSIEKEESAIQDLLELGVDGIIIYPVHGDYYNPKVLELVVTNFPVVFVDRFIKGIPASSVCTNNRLATKEATSYLFSLGHKDIGFVSRYPDGTSAIDDRIQGFHMAFSEKGVRLNPAYFLTNLSYGRDDQDIENDLLIIRDFINEYKQITAFMVCEYSLAVYLENILHRIGKRIPEDYSIICFDSPNLFVGEPVYTHIKQDEVVMGSEAVDLLISQINGDITKESRFSPYQLIEGKSTKRR